MKQIEIVNEDIITIIYDDKIIDLLIKIIQSISDMVMYITIKRFAVSMYIIAIYLTRFRKQVFSEDVDFFSSTVGCSECWKNETVEVTCCFKKPINLLVH